MIKLLRIVLLIYIGLIVFVLFDFAKGNEESSSSNKLQRPKRYLAFLNVSHFFLRLNFKANMVPWNQIFAQSVGFRMNWDDPPLNFRPHHHIYRRSLYKHLEVLMDRNSLSGFDCLRRAICELDMISKPRGVYHKILKIIFRRQSQSTNYWHNATSQDCEQSIASCPFSILEVSLFTDI